MVIHQLVLLYSFKQGTKECVDKLLGFCLLCYTKLACTRDIISNAGAIYIDTMFSRMQL